MVCAADAEREARQTGRLARAIQGLGAAPSRDRDAPSLKVTVPVGGTGAGADDGHRRGEGDALAGLDGFALEPTVACRSLAHRLGDRRGSRGRHVVRVTGVDRGDRCEPTAA